jgi:Icc-related predicted phosphoesterase
MVPITAHNGYWQVTLRGETQRLDSKAELDEVITKIRNSGFYPAVVSQEELTHLGENEGAVDQRFSQEMISSLDRWLDMADGKLRGGDIPCVLNGGNDDIFEIDNIIESSPCVSFGEGKLLDLDGFSLVSMGWTNPTPWDTYREAPEADLAAKIEAVAGLVPDMGRAIFNFHAPPYGSGLDEAPALDENLRPMHGGAVMKPVGSTAVRDAIVKHQPLLSVHGHIHESRAIRKMNRTLAINPGSVYGDGVLQGAVIDLDVKKAKVSRYLLVNG